MITKVIIPKLSANMEEGMVGSWLKKEGDRVKKNELLVEIVTDKATFEVEAPASGLLRQILAKEKSVLPVGYIIALIGTKKDKLPPVEEANRKLLEERRKILGKEGEGTRKKTGKTQRGRREVVRATPRARRLAKEMDLDLAQLKKKVKVEVITEEVIRRYLAKEKKK